MADGGGRWPNVSFMAESAMFRRRGPGGRAVLDEDGRPQMAARIEPMLDGSGEPVVGRDGRALWKALLRLPEGTTLRGRDLSGWLVSVPISDAARERQRQGRPFNVSLNPRRPLAVFRYVGWRRESLDRELSGEGDLWALARAVAAARGPIEDEARAGVASNAPALAEPLPQGKEPPRRRQEDASEGGPAADVRVDEPGTRAPDACPGGHGQGEPAHADAATPPDGSRLGGHVPGSAETGWPAPLPAPAPPQARPQIIADPISPAHAQARPRPGADGAMGPVSRPSRGAFGYAPIGARLLPEDGEG